MQECGSWRPAQMVWSQRYRGYWGPRRNSSSPRCPDSHLPESYLRFFHGSRLRMEIGGQRYYSDVQCSRRVDSDEANPGLVRRKSTRYSVTPLITPRGSKSGTYRLAQSSCSRIVPTLSTQARGFGSSCPQRTTRNRSLYGSMMYRGDWCENSHGVPPKVGFTMRLGMELPRQVCRPDPVCTIALSSSEVSSVHGG